MSASYGLDRLYYGVWTFPAARFIHFNLAQDLAVFYGRNRPDYYFTEGLPILLTLALPFTIAGMFQAFSPSTTPLASNRVKDHTVDIGSPPQSQHNPRPILRTLAITALTYPLILSLISHKEVRFLHPLLPFFIILSASPFASFFHPLPWPASSSKRVLLLAMLTACVGFTAYISYIHNRAPLTVVSYLRSQSIALNVAPLVLGTTPFYTPFTAFLGHTSLLSLLTTLFYSSTAQTPQPQRLRNISIAFLTPCHSTPWRSHLIYPELNAWALTCEPPIGLSIAERAAYLDEADVFYADPAAWLRENMDMDTLPLPQQIAEGTWNDTGWDRRALGVTSIAAGWHDEKRKRPWPRYLVFFAQLEPLVVQFLAIETGEEGSAYELCWRGFNSHWHDDWRRRGDMVVYCVGGGLDLDTVVRKWDEEHKADGGEGMGEGLL